MNTFSFRGANLRALTIDGNPWFVAADVCRILGIKEPHVAYRRIARDELTYRSRATVGLPPGRPMATVNESGLYKLIMRSDKPQAREFQDWVTREVLPSIRRTGGNDRHKK
jgi:prophage antirepressor-like protein